MTITFFGFGLKLLVVPMRSFSRGLKLRIVSS